MPHHYLKYRIYSLIKYLKSVDWSYLNLSTVTDIENMFIDYSHLASVNLSHSNLSSVTNIKNMFFDMHSLKRIDLSYLDASSSVINLESMFENNYRLVTINLTKVFLWYCHPKFCFPQSHKKCLP